MWLCRVVFALLMIAANSASQPAAGPYFPDLTLRDQRGARVRFYSDLVKDKVVVIHSFFGACHGACPVILSRIKYLQDHVSKETAGRVVFLSLSVDPLEDKPSKLGEMAGTLGAGPNWYLLSGVKENTDWILYKLGQYTPKREDHSTLLLIGNESAGEWLKVDAAAPAEQILKLLESVSRAATNPTDHRSTER